MRRIAFAAVAILLPFSFAGCGSDAPTVYETPGGVEDSKELEYGSLIKVNVGGTDCVVYDSYYGGGVDCDFP